MGADVIVIVSNMDVSVDVGVIIGAVILIVVVGVGMGADFLYRGVGHVALGGHYLSYKASTLAQSSHGPR